MKGKEFSGDGQRSGDTMASVTVTPRICQFGPSDMRHTSETPYGVRIVLGFLMRWGCAFHVPSFNGQPIASEWLWWPASQ